MTLYQLSHSGHGRLSKCCYLSSSGSPEAEGGHSGPDHLGDIGQRILAPDAHQRAPGVQHPLPLPGKLLFLDVQIPDRRLNVFESVVDVGEDGLARAAQTSAVFQVEPRLFPETERVLKRNRNFIRERFYKATCEYKSF